MVLRIVPTPRFDAQVARTMRDELETFLGPGVAVSLETVGRIPIEPSGKRLVIKSSLPTA